MKTTRRAHRNVALHLMVVPALSLIFIFNYLPMFGIVMSFQDFVPARGVFRSIWIGLGNYEFLLSLPNTLQVVWNTIVIAFLKILTGVSVPVVFALLLNEVRSRGVKRWVQTLVYLPHFLSWVILGGILIDVLSPSTGIVNDFLKLFGIEPVFFLGEPDTFRGVLVATHVWKEFGFQTIVYLAALTAISPTLYEAAEIDGANRWQQTIHITLPGMAPVIILMSALSLGNILNAGFDQVFNLYSPIVYQTGDIVDTLVYRIGLLGAQYGVAAAMGLFKSVVSCIFVVLSYWLAYRFANYRIF